jgi:hypothetical protein
MSSDTIDNATPAPDGGEPKPKLKSTKRGLKKAAKAKKTSKPKEERAVLLSTVPTPSKSKRSSDRR